VISLEVTDKTTQTYGLFGSTLPWVESSSTWLEAAKGYAWGAAGAAGTTDFLPTVLADVGPADVGQLDVSLNDIGQELVEQWINNPSSNHGLILKDYEGADDGLDVASREAETPGTRPQIQITYRSLGAVDPALPESLELSAYPNPFYDTLHVLFGSAATNSAVLELYDMLGRRVATRSVSAYETMDPISLSTSSLAAGVYALRVIQGSGVVSNTFMVTKGF